MNAQSARRSSLLIFHINDSINDQITLQAAANAAGLELSPKYPVRWPDLVVLELPLHDGSGLKVLKYIRSTPELTTVPVAVLTGDTNPATRQEADTLGANFYHKKPIDFEGTVRLVGLFDNTWSAAKQAPDRRD